MKKLIFIIIFIFITEISFAEATVEEVKQNSKIGIMIGYMKEVGFSYEESVSVDPSYDGIGPIDWENPEGISGNIFFNHPIHKKFFISLNLGYNSFKTQTQKVYFRNEDTILNKKELDNIVATLGVNWWCYSDKIYIGMGGGALHKRKNDYGKTETKPEFYFTGGFSYPIPKYRISIEANCKLSINSLFGINIGLAYLIQ